MGMMKARLKVSPQLVSVINQCHFDLIDGRRLSGYKTSPALTGCLYLITANLSPRPTKEDSYHKQVVIGSHSCLLEVSGTVRQEKCTALICTLLRNAHYKTKTKLFPYV